MKNSVLYRVYLALSIALILMSGNVGANKAQSDSEIVLDVIDGRHIKYFAWSFDNKTVAFLNGSLFEEIIRVDVELSQPAWQTFKVETQELSPGQTLFPLQAALSEEEYELFKPYNVILAAPDNNLLAFASNKPDSPSYLNFANRTTGQSIFTPLRTDNDQPFFSGRGSLKGVWSEEGNVFIYPQSNPFTPDVIYFHIRVDESDLEGTILKPFAPIIDRKTYVIFGIEDRYLDMSRQGDHVLAIARSEANYGEAPYLVVWITEEAADSYYIPMIQGEDICDASFTENDESIVILLRDGSMLLYQIDLQNVLTLPVSLPRECSFNSAFSPNGTWLAINDFTDQLKFFDIAHLIADQF